jgi:UDP-N-acetylglucosamine transferase subunit ALG13
VTPRVLVLVGTDFHRFDRLVGWIDRWAADRGADVLVQHGTSRPPEVAAGQPYLDWDKVQSEIAQADVVVSHGGPATISEARKAGHRPIVVPRDPGRDEHVDDHQQLFCRRLGASGLVTVAEDETALRAALDAAAAAGRGPAAELPAEILATTRRLGALVDGLLPAGAATPPAPERPRIAFLGGFGRSGSTLLERMLNEIPGVSAVGESVHLWQRGLRDDERCGCGEPFSRCPHWQAVGEAAFGGWDQLDVDHVLAVKAAVDRTRYVPRLAGPAASAKHARALDEYCDLYRRLYRGVAAVTGDSVLVDASKHASLAYALRRAADLDLRVLHMVRDSRGVAHSWSKQVRRTEIATTRSTCRATRRPGPRCSGPRTTRCSTCSAGSARRCSGCGTRTCWPRRAWCSATCCATWGCPRARRRCASCTPTARSWAPATRSAATRCGSPPAG